MYSIISGKVLILKDSDISVILYIINKSTLRSPVLSDMKYADRNLRFCAPPADRYKAAYSYPLKVSGVSELLFCFLPMFFKDWKYIEIFQYIEAGWISY